MNLLWIIVLVLVQAPDEPDLPEDIARTALIVAWGFDADVNVEQGLEAVDRITAELRKRMPDRVAPAEAVGIISEHLLETYAVDSANHTFDPLEGFLSRVLETRKGNCLGLSTLYLAVGRRMGLDLHMVRVPDHVFIRCEGLNIETTDHGRFHDDEHYRKKYRITEGRPYLSDLTAKQEVAELLRNRGLAWKERGRYEQALEDYSKALELHPRDALTYHNRGYVRMKMGRHLEAVEDYNKSIEYDPFNALTYLNRGYIWRLEGDHPRALADYTRSIELDDRDAQAYTNRGYIRYRQGDLAGAEKDYNRAVALDPADAQTYFNRSFVRREMARYGEAMADDLRAGELDPRFDRSRQRRGPSGRRFAPYRQDDYRKAVEDFTRSIRKEPDCAMHHYHRGAVLFLLGRYEEALADLDRAISLDGGHGWSYVRRAQVLVALDRTDEAGKDLEKAAALDRRLGESR